MSLCENDPGPAVETTRVRQLGLDSGRGERGWGGREGRVVLIFDVSLYLQGLRRRGPDGRTGKGDRGYSSPKSGAPAQGKGTRPRRE